MPPAVKYVAGYVIQRQKRLFFFFSHLKNLCSSVAENFMLRDANSVVTFVNFVDFLGD